MKIAQLTYEEALQRNPEETAKIIRQLRTSRSKERNVPAEDLNWSYECCTKGTCYSFADLLSGKAIAAHQAAAAKTLEEKIADQVARTSTVLMATKGHWFCSESIQNPPEVTEQARARFEKDADERIRFGALPKADQVAELTATLEELAKSQ